MAIDLEELEQVTTSVWELMMESTILRSDPSALAPDADCKVAFIRLNGAYNGTIALHLDDELVRLAAAAMFGTEDVEVTAAEMDDTARELANMVGGNVKCLVEQPTELGLPQLSAAKQFTVDGASEKCRLAFQHDGAALHVTVYE